MQISAKLRRTTNGISHWCPGCEMMHGFAVDEPFGNGARWSWDDNAVAPTLSPSMLIRTGRFADPTWTPAEPEDYAGGVCHYFRRVPLLPNGRRPRLPRRQHPCARREARAAAGPACA